MLLLESDDDLAMVWTLLLEWLGAEVVRLFDEGAPARREREVLVCETAALGRPWVRALASSMPTLIAGEDPGLVGARVLAKPIYPSVLSGAILDLA